MGLGEWAHHLVYPIRQKGKIVGFQGRDMTGRATTKYHTFHGSPLHECLYHSDVVKPGGCVVLVEGVFDVWRLGDGTVASFGTALSDVQRDKLFAMMPAEVVIAWDADAYSQAKSLAQSLADRIRVKALRLPRGTDPDELGMKRFWEIAAQTTWI